MIFQTYVANKLVAENQACGAALQIAANSDTFQTKASEVKLALAMLR